jgi:hypothetical protein
MQTKTNIQSVDGHIGGITFSLVGPPELVQTVVKFIRNLVKMSGGYYQ